jgi:hypothetical protein
MFRLSQRPAAEFTGFDEVMEIVTFGPAFEIDDQVIGIRPGFNPKRSLHRVQAPG